MKKFISMAVIVLMAAVTLTSCLGSDDQPTDPIVYLVASGAYVVNSGNQRAGVDGSLTYLQYEDAKVTQNVYKNANGASLGGTVNDAVVCGSKIYIVGSDEKTIFVADRSSAKKISNISTGSYTPRHIATNGKRVYVSTYDNKVLDIDTLSLSITKEYGCGNYSEGICAVGKYVFVADSNYGNGKEGASLSLIDTESGQTTKYTNDNIVNPTIVFYLVTPDSRIHLYYVDQGSYDENWNQSGQAVYELGNDSKSYKVCDATMAAISNTGILYAINAPYTNPETKPTYTAYNLIYGGLSRFIDGSDIETPAAIAVDPASGCVVISSYNKVDGYASYATPGYACIYDANGKKLQKFDTGVGPTAVCFNTFDYVVKNK